MARVSVFLLFCITTGMVTGYRLTPLKVRADPECKQSGFCESVEGYPIELARKLIQELRMQNVTFTNDKLSNDEITKIPETKTIIATRFGEEYDGNVLEEKSEPLCESRVKFSSPMIARDVNRKERLILNDPEAPVQTFRYETCKTPKCSPKISFLPTYKAECKQRYTLQEMYYIGKDAKTYVEYFPIASCCSCNIAQI